MASPVFSREGWEAERISTLADVDNTSPAEDGDTLKYNDTANLWEYESISKDDLTDFSLVLPADNDLIQYNSTTGYWENEAITGFAVNAFKTLSVAGQSDIVADSATDTLTLVEAGILAITTTAGTDTITFTATEAQTLDAVCLLGSSTTTDIDLTGTGPDITFTPTGGDAMGIHTESDIFILKNETDNHQWFRAEGSQDIFLNPDSGNVSIGGGLGFPDKLLYVNGTCQITGATQLDSTL